MREREALMNRRKFVRRSLAAATGSLLLRNPFSSAPLLQIKAAHKPALLSESMVYKHSDEDPYDPQNRYGFNHAPSVTLLSDGRLLAAWFSGPFEAAVNQVILGCYSSDSGLSLGACRSAE